MEDFSIKENTMRIRKAIIPAAGLGTRFLPATKSMPKEMLPIIDTPTIQMIVEEAIESGIEEILIITNAHKHEMENHFDINFELEARLRASEKHEDADLVHKIAMMANVHYVRQKEPRGLGHAVLCAKTFVGNEPFAVLLGDDLVVNRNGKPALKQLMDAYDKHQASILGVQTVAKENVSKYGIVAPKVDGIKDVRTTEIVEMVEKPKMEEAPSQLAVLGRYILTPEIFAKLEVTPVGKGNEIQLTDGIRLLLKDQKVFAYDFEGERYDVGDKFGFVKATIDFALERDDLKEKVSEYIKSIAK